MLRNVLTLFLFISLSPYAQADIESAKAAYGAGDYETAVKELLPLAEAGDAKAQEVNCIQKPFISLFAVSQNQ